MTSIEQQLPSIRELSKKDKDKTMKKSKFEDIPAPAMVMAQNFVNFLNESPSKYQVVDNSCTQLEAAGFTELFIDQPWNLTPGGKYFIVQNDSCLMSFILGSRYQQGNPFAIVATHTESPSIKIKHSSNSARHQYALVNCGLYGGGNWLTYFDRELKVAGKAFVRQAGKIVGRLVHIEEPICYVPNLAIHFTSYPPNLPDLETNLVPVIGLSNDISDDRHRSELMQHLSAHLSVPEDDIIEFDLSLVDATPARLVGHNQVFIAGQNQDNLVSTYSSVQAIIRASTDSYIFNAQHVAVAINYDHEEVGSTSPEGAATEFVLEVLKRISGGEEKYSQAVQNSFVVSCDVVHALHPNYAGLYEERNRVNIFGGMSVKYSPKLNYSTNGYTSMLAKEIGRMANVPMQDFVVRNDARSGSTLGPTLSAKLGIDSVDTGTSMLAMHSIREFSCANCIAHSTDYIESLFVNYGTLLASVRKSKEYMEK